MNQNLSEAAINWGNGFINVNKQRILAWATYSDEKVDHEEDVECQIYLLRGVLRPGHAGLHSVTEERKTFIIPIPEKSWHSIISSQRQTRG